MAIVASSILCWLRKSMLVCDVLKKRRKCVVLEALKEDTKISKRFCKLFLKW